MARTDTLPNFLTDVADAIREKKGSSDTILASDFDTEIENLPSGGGADLSEYFNLEITSDTDAAIKYYLLKKCPDVYISNNVTTLTYTFAEYSLNVIPKIHCNNNVINIIRMFQNCKNVTSIDLSEFDGSNLQYIAFAFTGCTSLTHLDIRKFEFGNAVSFAGLFGNSSTNYIPTNCEIIVKSNVEKQWINSNFQRQTNVKTVAEYEAE